MAVLADLVQFGILPLFIEGALSPLNDALDVVVCAVLLGMLGWHIALLPALVAELIPVANVAPTWTLAVSIIALDRRRRLGGDTKDAVPAPAAGNSHAEVIDDDAGRPPTPRGESAD